MAPTNPGSSSGPSSMMTQGEQREVGQAVPRYRGVVLQQNGHWGAQIYVHHGRIWLGTFKSEAAAARAYDSAAISLHRGDSHRNFPLTDITIHEPDFEKSFDNETLLNMIRDGYYESRLIEYVRNNHTSNSDGSGAAALHAAPTVIDNGVTFSEMFQKELTPSDVGRLNRLVIPKKHATRYFLPVPSNADEERLLEFRDQMNRVWVFRYCYWKSSKSYAFTRGWSRFVKEMELRARDTVVFYNCTKMEGSTRKTFYMILIIRGGESSGGDVEADGPVEDGEGIENSTEYEEEEGNSEKLMVNESERIKGVKIFGVGIR